jgi:hypothetical protein
MLFFDRTDSSESQSALVTDPDMITEVPSTVISMADDGDAKDMEENTIVSAAEKVAARVVTNSATFRPRSDERSYAVASCVGTQLRTSPE